MRHSPVILLFAVLSFNTSFSQGYIPLVDSTKMWTEDVTDCNPYIHHIYTATYGGDILIDSLHYSIVVGQIEASIDSLFIREDTTEKKVYCIWPSLFHECEYLLYDFNLQVGDTFYNNIDDSLCASGNWIVVAERSVEFFAGKNRIKLTLDYTGSDMIWYEGIGSLFDGVFRPRFLVGAGVNLLCYFENSDLLYHNTSLSSDCFVYSGSVLSDKVEFKVLINDHELNINTNSQTEFNFELFDITGRKRIAGKYKGSTNIDLSELSKGIYIYNIRGDGSDNKVSGKVFVSE